MFQKVAGYILLAVGLLLIIVPLFQTYQIFMGNQPAPQIFTVSAPIKADANASNFDIQKQIQNAVINALPLDLLNNILSLSGWLMLMFILMFGGKLLADIGVKLISIPSYYHNGD